MRNNITHPPICERIAKIRVELFGVRGKAAFAKRLGLASSTYDYYESTRVPPAEFLVKIADTAGVDLRWLLTGETSPQPLGPGASHVIQKAATLMDKHPDSIKPLIAFIDVLEEAARKFPQKNVFEPKAVDGKHARIGWIAVVGRSAAGVPAFWESGEDEGVTKIDDLIEHAIPADSARVSDIQIEADASAGSAQLVTLTQADERGLCEYIVCPGIKAKYPDAFAMRIDGESMSPEIRHGDCVIVSPSVPAVNASAAVVQLAGQIGVTCKLYRREASKVHLVSIAPHVPPQVFEDTQVLWALKVLGKVRA